MASPLFVSFLRAWFQAGGELVAKCLCKMASFIKSIWHLISPSYDNKVSIYTLNYWCTWLQRWQNLCEHAFANASRHYYAKHFALMLAMFAKFFVQCTVHHKHQVSNSYHHQHSIVMLIHRHNFLFHVETLPGTVILLSGSRLRGEEM